MSIIAETIERLVSAEYGLPAPPHFQRAAEELFRSVLVAIRDSVKRDVDVIHKGKPIKLSESIAHFPVPEWNWRSPAAPIIAGKVGHGKEEVPLVVSALPDAFAGDVPPHTYLALARGAAYWYEGPGPLPTYHLYLTPERIEELKGISDAAAREFFIHSRYIPYRLYEDEWPVTVDGSDYTRKLTIALGPVQLQADKHWAHLPVIFYVTTSREEDSGKPDVAQYAMPRPSNDLALAELKDALARLEDALAGKESPKTGELFAPGEVETVKVPAVLLRSIGAIVPNLGEHYDPERASMVPDCVTDPERRKILRRLADSKDAGKRTLFVHNPGGGAASVKQDWIVRIGDEAWRKGARPREWKKKAAELFGTLDDTALAQVKPSKEDLIRVGLSEVSLGTLGVIVSMALGAIAHEWKQGNNPGPPRTWWPRIARMIYPRYDDLPKTAQDACVRRIRRKVIYMNNIRAYIPYHRRGEKRIVDTNWVSYLDEPEDEKKAVYIRLGISENDYLLACSVALFGILADDRFSDNAKTLLLRLAGDTWVDTGGEKNMTVGKLLEYGGWKSHDLTQNRGSLAKALSLAVEVGYFRSATLNPDGESYHLVRGKGHYFPPKLIEDEKAYPRKKRGKKAYPRKKDAEDPGEDADE